MKSKIRIFMSVVVVGGRGGSWAKLDKAAKFEG